MKLNYKDFPGAAQHGDAFQRFVETLDNAQGFLYDWGFSEHLKLWTWFLAGWKQKAKQRVDLRCKTR